MSSNNTIFTGASRYASDFQQIIDRSVAIASLPLVQLQSQKMALGDQSAALTTLDAKLVSLQGVIQSLEAAAGGSYSTSVSDGAVVRASLSGSPLEGVYSVEVVDIGSYTSAMSADGLASVTDPSSGSISSASEFTLTVDGVDYSVTPASNTLSALADAINALSGAGVQATIVNIGSSTSPDYRLSLQCAKLGAVTVQLNDGSQDLLDTLSTGTLASYKVNGQPSTPISSDSRTVTLAPGLSVTLLKAGTAEVSVSRSASGVSSALSSFVTTYNSLVDELDLHRGEQAGALRGNSILYGLSQALREITGYSSETGAISSLASLGLSFNEQGKLSLDMTVFSSATSGQFGALASFLGSSSGGGFLQFATGVLNGLEDTTDGVLKMAIRSIQTDISGQDARIAEQEDRIDRLRQNLEAQMAAADALIASLEQQVKYINGLFESMRVARESMR
jgi:flagellar hook-associated protein 2